MTHPPTDTKALRELLEKATPGPWTSSYFGDGQFVVTMPRERSLRFHPRPPSGCDSQSATVYGAPGMAKTSPGDVIVGMAGHELDGLTEQEYAAQRVNDGQWIVAIVNAAPALLDEIDALNVAAKAIQADRDRLLRLNVDLVNERDALKAEVATLSDLVRQGNLNLSASEAEVERLTAERLNLIGEAGAASTRANRLEAEVERLRAALGEMLTDLQREANCGTGYTMTGKWLDRMRAALRGEESPRG